MSQYNTACLHTVVESLKYEVCKQKKIDVVVNQLHVFLTYSNRIQLYCMVTSYIGRVREMSMLHMKCNTPGVVLAFAVFYV